MLVSQINEMLLHSFQITDSKPKNNLLKQRQEQILNTHPDRCRRGRQTCSSRSGRGGTGVRLGWMAGAAG